MQVEPVAELRFVDIFVQHRPDGEGAARVLDALAHALDHRGRDLGFAGMLGRADLQDVTVVWKRHRCTSLGRQDYQMSIIARHAKNRYEILAQIWHTGQRHLAIYSDIQRC